MTGHTYGVFEVKRCEDGRGPYRWAHVIKTPEGLAMGTIYRQTGDLLTVEEASQLKEWCDRCGFDLRRTNRST